MTVLEKFTQQSEEVRHYDMDFTQLLAALGDSPVGIPLVTVADGATQPSPPSLTGGVLKFWFAGGVDGYSYKVTVTMTTSSGWVEQQEVLIKVKDY